MSIIPILGRLRQKDCYVFKVNLGYREKSWPAWVIQSETQKGGVDRVGDEEEKEEGEKGRGGGPGNITASLVHR